MVPLPRRRASGECRSWPGVPGYARVQGPRVTRVVIQSKTVRCYSRNAYIIHPLSQNTYRDRSPKRQDIMAKISDNAPP